MTDKTDSVDFPATIFDQALAQVGRELGGRVLVLRPGEPVDGVPEDLRLIILDDRQDRGANSFRAAANAGAFERVGLDNGPRRAPENSAEADRFLDYVRNIVLQPPPGIVPAELQVQALIVANARHLRRWPAALPDKQK